MPQQINLMPPVAFSPTLEADARVAQLRAQQKRVLHMGFGQAPFPAPPRMEAALADAAGEKAYLPVAGLPELRQAVAAHQARHLGIDSDGFDVIVAPGSKLILYAAQMAIAGDLLLPVPSWVSYAPQAKMLGQQVVPVPVSLMPEGMIISADTLSQSIYEARASGRRPSKILLNYPNNPTGLTIPDEALKQIAEVCIRENIVIISDEIYGRVTFDGGYRSISTYAPDLTIVTTGLSKHMSLGGWRLGIGTIPKALHGLFDALVGIASETWSCVAAPVQIAAIEAYVGHADIEAFIDDTTKIHKLMTHYVCDGMPDESPTIIRPQGGFYVWPEFSTLNLESSRDLSQLLADRFGLVCLPGTAFGEAPQVLRLRLSVCDYDGAAALRAWRQKDGGLTVNDVPHVAPNVAESVRCFKALAEG